MTMYSARSVFLKKKSPPTAHQLMFLFLYSMIVYWYIDSGLFWAEITEQLTVRERDSWRLHMWVNSRATVSLAASIFSCWMSWGRSLTFVMEITFRNGSKMEHFTFVIKWLLLQMSSWPARNTTTTTQVLQPSLISSTCSVLLIKPLCVFMEVFLSKLGGSIHRPIKNEHAWVPCTSLYSHVRHLVSTKTDLLKLKSSSSHGNLKQHHTNAAPQHRAAYLSQHWGSRVMAGQYSDKVNIHIHVCCHFIALLRMK